MRIGGYLKSWPPMLYILHLMSLCLTSLRPSPILTFFWLFVFSIFYFLLLTTGTGRIASYLGETTPFYVVRSGHMSYFLRANSISTFLTFWFFRFFHFFFANAWYRARCKLSGGRCLVLRCAFGSYALLL